MRILTEAEIRELSIDLSKFKRSAAGKRTFAKLEKLFDGDLFDMRSDSATMRNIGKREAFRFLNVMAGDVANAINEADLSGVNRDDSM